MNAKLFRENAETRDSDIHWSVVGPGHNRAYFSLIAIAGYSADTRTDKHPYFAGPFQIYSMGKHAIPQKHYKTIAAAKRAARAWVIDWISKAENEVSWTQCDTGVHFEGHVSGIQVANYYFCPEAKGHWHKDFRVWFGGTYYTTDFESPEQARAAIATTYLKWLEHARASLCVGTK